MKQMNSYISDNDIKDEILFDFPVPDNITSKTEMDSNIKSLLFEKKANETLALDKAFGSVQEKIGNIFGPISQLWDFIETQKNDTVEQISKMEGDIPEEAEQMLKIAKDCSRLMDTAVTTIGQAFNSVSYYRRRNALLSIMKGDKKKVKTMLKENKDILQENTSKRLFGEKIDEKITEFVKLKKKFKEFLRKFSLNRQILM